MLKLVPQLFAQALNVTGQLALDRLHKKVLPFIMRRLKEAVLKDLPPKIIQDYYCELTPLQVLPTSISLFD
jgi:SNF2 family DNA or RNA helicase